MITGLKPRPKAAHKGMFGHVLVLGGDYGMPGAVKLAAMGARKMGAGLVTVVTQPLHITAVVNTQPELLCYGLEKQHIDLLNTLLNKASMIILGPGLGQSTWSQWLFKTTIAHLYAHQTPCLIDADGLNWVAQTNWTPLANCIFTPHPGEAARLLKTTVETIEACREKSIKQLQKIYGGTVVLKGAHSLVYMPQKPLYICHQGNPAMATGGMGDLLSGIIAGLVTQGLVLDEAARQGVLLHAAAGDAALKKQGGPSVLASDLIPELKRLF